MSKGLRPWAAVAVACVLWLALAAPQTHAQSKELEGLLSGGGKPFEILSDIAQGEVADASGELGSLLEGLTGPGAGETGGLGEALDALDRILGVKGNKGTTATGTPGVPADELTRARTCGQAMGHPMFDPVVRRIMASGFGVGAADTRALRELIGLVQRLPLDACMLRDVLVMEALLDVLSGRYTTAAATLDALIPAKVNPKDALTILAQSAHAAVFALQLREDEARAMIERLRPAIVAGLGPDSRLVQMLDGALADMDIALGRTARAGGDEARAQYLFGRADRRYRDIASRLGSTHSRGHADELACIALGSRGTATLLSGDAAGAVAVLSPLLDSSGTCARDFPRNSLLGSSKLIDLGLAHLANGDHNAAEDALLHGRAMARDLRGYAHPDVIRATRGLAELRALQRRPDAAVALITEMDDALLEWLGGALRGTTSQALRRRIAALQADHQDLALLVARAFPEHAGAQTAAAQSVLRYKGMQGEEDALLNRLVSQADDAPEIARLAQHVAALRSDLAAAANAGAGGLATSGSGRVSIERREAELSAAEAELQRLSGQFARQVAVRGAKITEVQARLRRRSETAALVEYRLVRQRALGTLERGDAPLVWHAVVIAPDLIRTEMLASADEVAVLLSNVEDRVLLRDAARSDAAREILANTRELLWERLIAPLGIAEAQDVFIAPEGALTLAPFLALDETDSGIWANPALRRVTLLPSGRALLPERVPPEQGGSASNRRLLALGGIDYGAPQAGERAWRSLPGTQTEIETVAGIATSAEWQAEILSGGAAREAGLRARLAPVAPAIVHLATHGFFHDAPTLPDRLSALSGVALAGANLAQSGHGGGPDDGTLFALEVEGLNLQHTFLLVVSACSSGLGPVERGEGVHGLNRAFRIAGARYTFVTLREVGDRQAQHVMEIFYRHLFANVAAGPSDLDPALAFQRTMIDLIGSSSWIDIGAYTLMRHK